MKKILVAILVLVLSFSTMAHAADRPITWVTQTCFALASPLGNLFLTWADRVNEMSGGRLVITVHDAGEIIPPMATYEAVRDGLLDAAMNTPAWQAGLYPAGDLFYTLPGGITETIELITWAWTDGRRLMQEMYGDSVIALPFGLTPPEIWWSTRRIETLDDLSGMRIRSAGLCMALFERLGMSVVMLAGGEVLPALRQGVIDAVEFAFPTMDEALGIHEVAQYMLAPPIHMGSNMFQILIHPARWEELPSDLQAIVTNAASAVTFEMYAQLMSEQGASLRRMIDHGVTVIRLSPECQRRAHEISLQLLEDHSQLDPFFAKVWESQRQMLESLTPFINMSSFDLD